MRAGDPGPDPGRGPGRHDPRLPLELADPERPVRRGVARPRLAHGAPASRWGYRWITASPSISTSRGRTAAKDAARSSGSLGAGGRTIRSAPEPRTTRA